MTNPHSANSFQDKERQDAINRLLTIMARLRDPEAGCPWDMAQDFSSIAPYTIEEAYEVADAIERGDLEDLKNELGDLLLQVVFHSRMAEESGFFSFDDVAAAIADKMERRHPHVFGSETQPDAESQTRAWEVQKEDERLERAASLGVTPSALDGVAANLPSLMRAIKLQKRAARVGFDWEKIEHVLEKIDEELQELRAELTMECLDDTKLESELGDVLFSIVNLARRLAIDPDRALRTSTAKFERRFRLLEHSLSQQGLKCQNLSLSELERHWSNAKQHEK